LCKNLIVDGANDETLNRYGIDIRPATDFSFYAISNQRVLIYKKQHLAKLEGLTILDKNQSNQDPRDRENW
jgi:hypothetical protein